MSFPTVIAFADDLTGAAEIAAIGHRYGLPARVVARLPLAPSAAPGLTVYDTDSRLESTDVAANRVTEAVRFGTPAGPVWCFKKTDSVLRGPVAAECRAFAAARGQSRVLLVPCNPSLSRTIRDGNYFVAGVPLHQTAFSRDPHHPAASSQVTALLRATPVEPVLVLPAGTPLPTAGFCVGEAETTAHLDHWARLTDDATAAAGGAEFFAANLRARGLQLAAPGRAPELPSPTLVVSGTTSPESRSRLQHLASKGVGVSPMPESLFASTSLPGMALAQWTAGVTRALEENRLAITPAPNRVEGGAATAFAIRAAFAALVGRLHARRLIRHLVIEGGATAATILQALDHPELEVVHEWAQGVITLRPSAQPDLLITLKPGSYAWPEGWWQRVHAAFAS